MSNGGGRRAAAAGFTLTELLVVMGVIGLLAGLTAVSYRAVAKDAKLASGKNAVISVLNNARALAMKNNRPTMVMFSPRFVNEKSAPTEAIIAEWRGDVVIQDVFIPPPTGTTGPRVFERFIPVSGMQPRQLPDGINVAGPNFKTYDSFDDHWFVPSNPLKIEPNTSSLNAEAPGRCVAILFGPDGNTMTHVPKTATLANNYPFVDRNVDGLQNRLVGSISIDTYYEMRHPADEPCAELVPYLAVFDEEQARDLSGDDDWIDPVARINELSQYINANADRIHFNRYTGVAMK